LSGIFQGANPDLSAGKETSAPIINPIPVNKKGGMLESRVASEARDAHKTIAPRVKRSAFIPKVYGTKPKGKINEKSQKTKSFFEKTPLTHQCLQGLVFISFLGENGRTRRSDRTCPKF
jgi:hypothetical protein